MARVGTVSENLEDYLERIFDIIRTRGTAKVSELAKAKGVAMSSVNSAIARLEKEGLVTHDLYKNINLTGSGARLALELERRHTAIRDFLVNVLGVKKTTADKDACAIEHHLDPETVRKMTRYSPPLYLSAGKFGGRGSQRG